MPFQVEFVSPEAVLCSGEGTQVVARTRGGGDIAFLAGHEPFIGSLQPSEVRVTETSGNVLSFAVRSGFVSVTGTSVTVLSGRGNARGRHRRGSGPGRQGNSGSGPCRQRRRRLRP
ncbi:MAG: F0F1 ATP synthase subunit epsilon [Acidimicrobiales bacterium]